MPFNLRPVLVLLACLAQAGSSKAQEPGIQWRQDIETAKSQAHQSGRMVLVHVIADGCGPCRSLEQNVFNQPGVAAAIEQQFVPVKLNANEYPAIAQGFGITRVPTDVIISPEGEVIGKLISPATPAAYVAETTQIASRYTSQSGKAYQKAAANAPNPAVLNSPYADLPVGMTSAPLQRKTNDAGSTSAEHPSAPANASTYNPYAISSPAPTAVQVAPASITNNYAPATTVPTNPAANPYGSYAPPSGLTASQPPMTPTATPAQIAPTPQYGYEPGIPTTFGAPVSTIEPPSNPTSLVSEEAPQFGITQQSATAPDARQLPAGAPPLGFDGFCPVSMRGAWKWIPGDPKFGAIHRGRTYWFAGPQEQQEFLARPDFYSPALAGIDPVLAIDHRQSVPGLREHSLDYDGQFFLFSSEATLQQFTSSPDRYSSGVRQAMGMQPSQQTR